MNANRDPFRWTGLALVLGALGLGVTLLSAATPPPQPQAPAAPAAAAAAAAAAKVKPDRRTRDCTSGGCHAEQTKYKVLHGPVQIGSCESCHLHADERQHTFKFRAVKAELCTFCHIGGGGPAGKVAHKPFAEGQCVQCHNPHGGSSRILLRTDDLQSLCSSCHDDVTKGRKHLHGPVATGSCAACHSSHRSTSPKLLAAEGRDLCLSCHDKMQDQIKGARFVHQPVEKECTACHEVHASDHKMQIKSDPATLCASCHEQVKADLAAPVKHSAATQGEACLNCHLSHGGDYAKLMKAEPAKACLSCHDKPTEAAGGRVVAAMSSVADPKLNRHGPLREGDCSGCHISHGSKNEHLLAKPYSPLFYQPFALEKYDLCFQCHDRQLVLQERTDTLTGFRNGEVNLHYLHVNKPDKGRNCRACHNTHTSTRPLHMRETVPYGQWELPIGAKFTDTGGSCKSACHEEYGYDRKNPVKNQKRAAP